MLTDSMPKLGVVPMIFDERGGTIASTSTTLTYAMRPDDLQASGRLPQLPRLPSPDGGPPKTERPESLHPD